MPQTTRNPYAHIARRFKSETAKHKMTIVLDQGLHRHLRFMAPGASEYWFDLITVPGALIFQGDGESFVFRRLTDMFEFFRRPATLTTHINPHYWSEKLTNGRDSVKVYSKELLEQRVREALAAARECGDRPRGVVKAVFERVIDSWEADHEGGARQLLNDFEFGGAFRVACSCGGKATFTDDDSGRDHAAYQANVWKRRHEHGHGTHRIEVERVEPFRFADTSEWDLKDYDWWFLWACHAIVWGIAQYDAARKAVA